MIRVLLVIFLCLSWTVTGCGDNENPPRSSGSSGGVRKKIPASSSKVANGVVRKQIPVKPADKPAQKAPGSEPSGPASLSETTAPPVAADSQTGVPKPGVAEGQSTVHPVAEGQAGTVVTRNEVPRPLHGAVSESEKSSDVGQVSGTTKGKLTSLKPRLDTGQVQPETAKEPSPPMLASSDDRPMRTVKPGLPQKQKTVSEVAKGVVRKKLPARASPSTMEKPTSESAPTVEETVPTPKGEMAVPSTSGKAEKTESLMPKADVTAPIAEKPEQPSPQVAGAIPEKQSPQVVAIAPDVKPETPQEKPASGSITPIAPETKPMAPSTGPETQPESGQKPRVAVVEPAPSMQPGKGMSAELLAKRPLYDPRGRVDPFIPLVREEKTVENVEEDPKLAARRKKKLNRRRLTPLEKIDLSQLKLVGIIRAESGNRALVQEATGKGYIVTVGTKIGRKFGSVKKILRDRIIVEEEEEDELENTIIKERVIKLQRPPGEDYHEL